MRFLLLAFIPLILSCFGRGTDECFAPPSPTCKTMQNVVLPASGGTVNLGVWSLSVEKGVLKEDAQLAVSDCPDANLGVMVERQFQAESSGSVHSLTINHPPSDIITPLKVEAIQPIQYLSSERIKAQVNTSGTGLVANELVIMKNNRDFLTPDFTQTGTASTATFVIEPPLVQSLASSDDEWIYTLSDELREPPKCITAAIEDFKTKLANALGDKINEFGVDPCQLCEDVADTISTVEKCREFVSSVGSRLCEGAISVAELKGWKASVANAFCDGSSFIGGWATYFLSFVTSASDVPGYLCNVQNKDKLDEFLAQYKLRTDCLCSEYVKLPQCPDRTSPEKCQEIWSETVEDSKKADSSK